MRINNLLSLFQKMPLSMIVYQIRIRSSQLLSNNAQSYVSRSFTNFVNMHGHLITTYLPEGIIIPGLPQNDSGIVPKDVIERQRSQIERYLNRVARHNKLMSNVNFLMFIKSPEELPEVKDNHWRSLLLCTSIAINDQDVWFQQKQVNTVILMTIKADRRKIQR